MWRICSASSRTEGGERVDEEITEIKERLAAIESLLQRLPEVQAAVFLQMWDEYQSARLTGKKPKDIWTIPPQGLR